MPGSMIMRAFFFLFLSFFHAVSAAQELRQLHLLDQPEKSPSEIVALRDVNGRYCAAIQVISDMEGFSFQAYNGVVKVEHAPGQDMVFVSPDERVLEIYHSGFEPLKIILAESGIRLSEKEVWRIKIAGEHLTSRIAITIIGTPDDAVITIDGEKRPSVKQQTVTLGSHELHIARPGFQPQIKTIFVDEDHTLFEYSLEPEQEVPLRITSTPSDASVYLDDALIGRTPVATFYTSGRFKLRIEKELYVPYEDYIDIQPLRTTKNYTLQPDFGEIMVSSAPENGLEIFLDGRPTSIITPGNLRELKTGSYRVKARSEFFDTEEMELSLSRGEKKIINLVSNPIFATLTIKTLPGAKVTLDGKILDRLDNLRLPPGIITLRAELSKAPAVEKRIILRKGEIQTVDLLLQLPIGTIQIAAIPDDASITLSGDGGEKYTGTGEKSFTSIIAGLYHLMVTRKDFSPHEENIILREGEKITRQIKLTPSEKVNPDESKRIGKTYFNDHKDSLAIVYMEKSLAANPDQPDLFTDMGASYMRLKQWDKAAAMYQKKFNSDPSYAVAYINYALCKMALKDWEQARLALLKTVELRPSYSMGYLYLARTLSQTDSISGARHAYEKWADLVFNEKERYSNELGEAYRYIAFSHLVEKDYSPALDAITHALQFRPMDVELNLWSAQVLHALNRRDEARAQYRKVLGLDPRNTDAKKGMDILDLYN